MGLLFQIVCSNDTCAIGEGAIRHFVRRKARLTELGIILLRLSL